MPPALTLADVRVELDRCLSCEAKPCRAGCPAGLSPADFIAAARCGEPSDLRRAAAHVLGHNPLGGVCGALCPETLCRARCARGALDAPVDIPAVQGAIVAEARRRGVLPAFTPAPATGHAVAVVGAGPAGLAAAAVLARAGHAVHVLERARRPGGMARLVPARRLDPAVLEGDLAWLVGQGGLRLVLGRPVALPRDLLGKGYGAVVVTAGLAEAVPLAVPGGRRALPFSTLLGPRPPALRGRRVAVVGDGPVALDCAEAARALGATHVELLALRALPELPFAGLEWDRLVAAGVHLSGRVRVTALRWRGARLSAVALRRVDLPAGQTFHPSRLTDVPGSDHVRRDLDAVVVAAGSGPGLRLEGHPRIFYAGDLATGPSTVVEAVASGKAAALAVHRLLSGEELAACPDRATCAGGDGCPRRASCVEWSRPEGASGGAASPPRQAGLPVPLGVELGGRALVAPFLLGAAPFTRTPEAIRRAYAAGWPGAVLRPRGGDAAALASAHAAAAALRAELPDRLTLVAEGDAPVAGVATGDFDDYRGAARLLALGARAVLCDGVVVRRGLGVLAELSAGLSWHLAERGLSGPAALATCPPPFPSADDGERVSHVDAARCTGCGSCARCPSGAVILGAGGVAVVDPDRCDGCGLCLAQCAAGAVALRHAAAEPTARPPSSIVRRPLSPGADLR